MLCRHLIERVHRSGCKVLWLCDPMHGNTVSVTSGQKTRRFDDVLGELRSAFAIHRNCGSKLNGVHLELTVENVNRVHRGFQRPDGS